MLTAIIRSCTGGEARIQRRTFNILFILIVNMLRVRTRVVN